MRPGVRDEVAGERRFRDEEGPVASVSKLMM